MKTLKNLISMEKKISFINIYKKNKYFLFFFNILNNNLNISHIDLTLLLMNTKLDSFYVSGINLNSFFGYSEILHFLNSKYLVIFSNDLNEILKFLNREEFLKLNLVLFSFLFEKNYFINYSFFKGDKLLSLYNSNKDNYVKIISIISNFTFLYVILNYISYILQLIQLAVSVKIVNKVS